MYRSQPSDKSAEEQLPLSRKDSLEEKKNSTSHKNMCFALEHAFDNRIRQILFVSELKNPQCAVKHSPRQTLRLGKKIPSWFLKGIEGYWYFDIIQFPELLYKSNVAKTSNRLSQDKNSVNAQMMESLRRQINREPAIGIWRYFYIFRAGRRNWQLLIAVFCLNCSETIACI